MSMYSLTRLFFDNSRQVNARDGQAFRVKTYLVLAAVMLKQQLLELVVYPAFVGYGKFLPGARVLLYGIPEIVKRSF